MADEEELHIMIDKVKEAIKVMKKRKALGSDGIEAEMRQAFGEKAAKVVWHLYNGISRHTKYASKCYRSVLIPIYKKDNARKFSNYCILRMPCQYKYVY